MLTLFQSVIYGLVQGVAEFLPISSTAHLILVPYFFGWPDPGLSFDVGLHFGTLIAVLVYFWPDWMAMLAGTRRAISGGVAALSHDPLVYILVATVPGAVFGLLFEKKAETVFRSPLVIAVTLIVAGAILYWFDKKNSGTKKIADMNWIDALVIGISQAVAIIPGVSRSGATMTAGLASGYDKTNAARFSFLLSTPIIAGAALLKLPDLMHGFSLSLVVAVCVSAVAGYCAIEYLFRFVSRHSFKSFFVYRVVLGLLVVAVYFFHA